jgi:ClpP class serine protease
MHILDNARERFVEIVELGRKGKMTTEEIEAATTGHVFTAQEALDGNLVDASGYLDAAIDKAKSLAGIGESVDPHVTIMKPVGGFGLLGLMGSNRGVGLDSPISSQQIRRWIGELSAPRVEYRMGPATLH